jgi:hypothetical protein
MFNNISWASYWSALFIATTIYYTYVLIVYYRSDIFSWLNNRTRGFPATHSPAESLANHLQETQQINDEKIMRIVQSFTDEVTAYLEQAARARSLKPEIIFALKQITKKFGSIKDTPYENVVNSLLQFEVASKCGIDLSEAEIRQVWLV